MAVEPEVMTTSFETTMDNNATSKLCLPSVLVVSNSKTMLISNSSVIASLDQVCISILEATKILPWVQQHQPDLIILDISWSQIIKLQLIAALRVDWLTRNIPILVITSSRSQQLQSWETLDYDACLFKPYAMKELEQTICSLVSTPACETYSNAV
ncbi:MAG: response regulator [Cyanobacteria bacterium P01_G01_bin.67]